MNIPTSPSHPAGPRRAGSRILTWRRAAWRYPEGVPEKVRKLIVDELALIASLDYARLFSHRPRHRAFRRGSRHNCARGGAGSAANSAVCYALGITAVDPSVNDLLFARFISSERREPPDIDVDFEHERREGSDPVHLWPLRARACRHRGDRHHLSPAQRHPRGRQGARPDQGRDGQKSPARVWGSWGDEIPDAQVREAGLDPNKSDDRPGHRPGAPAAGFSPPTSPSMSAASSWRAGGLDEMVPIGNAAYGQKKKKPHLQSNGNKDDIDTLGLMKVERAGARHAHLHPQGLRSPGTPFAA